MLGEVPLPSYGGIFTQIDKNTVALTGGIVKPNMFINPVEILVKDLNIKKKGLLEPCIFSNFQMT